MALQAGMAMTNGGWARADTLGKVHLAAIAAYGARARLPAVVPAAAARHASRGPGGLRAVPCAAAPRACRPSPCQRPRRRRCLLRHVCNPAGVRLAGFVLWRDNLPSYQARKESNDAKLKDFPLWKVGV